MLHSEKDNYGTKRWFQNYKRHRLDGPAVEFNDGHKLWYIEGIYYPKWIAIYIILKQYKPSAKEILKLMSYIKGK